MLTVVLTAPLLLAVAEPIWELPAQGTAVQFHKIDTGSLALYPFPVTVMEDPGRPLLGDTLRTGVTQTEATEARVLVRPMANTLCNP
ncbi:MAG: hypothetical protein DLM70_02180 [Chloroflexi bacterium]|nr:MAG: hypothetical protein DLM70_02180 [Chloroflexota bacterium]